MPSSSSQTINRKMKREGRQHGMVRTCRSLPAPWNPRPESRFGQRLNSPPTAGLFTKVPSKPTNHSKFTGKCSRARCLECHMHPTSKSKDKTKGTQKLKSGDVAANYQLVTWRVVDGPHGFNVSRLSATGMLDNLSGDHYEDYYREDDDDNDIYRQGDDGMTNSWTLMEQANDVNENNDVVDVGFGFGLDRWE